MQKHLFHIYFVYSLSYAIFTENEHNLSTAFPFPITNFFRVRSQILLDSNGWYWRFRDMINVGIETKCALEFEHLHIFFKFKFQIYKWFHSTICHMVLKMFTNYRAHSGCLMFIIWTDIQKRKKWEDNCDSNWKRNDTEICVGWNIWKELSVQHSMIDDPYKTRMIGWYLNETVSDRKNFASLICRKWKDIGIKIEGSDEI